MPSDNRNFGSQVLEFYDTLVPPTHLVDSVTMIQPHKEKEVWGYMENFFNKFFQDAERRVFVIGINAGRRGSGTTGVPFTDPVALETSCRIPNALLKREEMSSQFIYRFIANWGNTQAFYKQFYFTGMLPVGLMRDGKNCNYYDSPELLSVLKPFVVETLIRQFEFGARSGAVIILGSGKNAHVFRELNDEHRWFKEVYVLEHPRFVAQYQRKNIAQYLDKYHDAFAKALARA